MTRPPPFARSESILLSLLATFSLSVICLWYLGNFCSLSIMGNDIINLRVQMPLQDTTMLSFVDEPLLGSNDIFLGLLLLVYNLGDLIYFS